MTASPGRRRTLLLIPETATDWGGASRVLFNNLRALDLDKFDPIVLLPEHGPVVAELRARSIRHLIWGPLNEPGKSKRYLRSLFAFVRLLRDNRVELVHFNRANYWRPAEMLAAKMLRLPVITHYHVAIDEPGPFNRLSTRIVAVSEFVANHSLPRNLPKTVIHNAVDLSRFEVAATLRDELKIEPGALVISFIGQIREIKGIDSFLALTRRLSAGSFRFLVAGACRDPQRIGDAYTEARLRAEMGDDPRITYLGYRTDVEQVYLASDIVVVPSRWQEPFGLVVIEAGACGKPVVATRVGGIPEVITHEDNGCLAEPGDLEGLCRLTRRLADDPDLRARMGRRAREVVARRFTSLPVRKLEAVYAELLAPGRR